jgi:hypothetical protein
LHVGEFNLANITAVKNIKQYTKNTAMDNIALEETSVIIFEAYNVYPQSIWTNPGFVITLIHGRFLSIYF